MNKTFIKRKISLIQDELAKLAEFAHYSLEDVVNDSLRQAALERYLERIITRAIDINQHLIAELATQKTSPPKDYRETFLQLADFDIYPKSFAEQIAKSVGTRNVLVHEYDKVDYSLIYNSVNDCLKDYHQYCEYILRFIQNK